MYKNGINSANRYILYQPGATMINGVNSMVPIAHVRVGDKDFNAYISICSISRNIHVFKYDEYQCKYDVFPSQAEAQVWINKDLYQD